MFSVFIWSWETFLILLCLNASYPMTFCCIGDNPSHNPLSYGNHPFHNSLSCARAHTSPNAYRSCIIPYHFTNTYISTSFFYFHHLLVHSYLSLTNIHLTWNILILFFIIHTTYLCEETIYEMYIYFLNESFL